MSGVGKTYSVGFVIRPGMGTGVKMEHSMMKAGPTIPTRTQEILQLRGSKPLPDWVFDIRESRPCWKNATYHRVVFYDVALVMTPPNPEATIMEVE